jgi:xanthine dehydrogenase accessory factor
MNEFWKDILTASENSTPSCLATVIATEGTEPRKEGSKMLIVGGASLKGAVTIGGCVDAQVIEAAEEVARAGEPRVLRAQLGEEDAFEIGLTCAGALRVLVEPVRIDAEIARRMRGALDAGTPFALITVARSSIPSVKTAAKLMVAPAGAVYPVPQSSLHVDAGNILNIREGQGPKAADGTPWYGVYGSLGDPRLDAAAAKIAADLLSKGISRALALDESFRPSDGQKQSPLEIFVEVVGYSPDLFIFGAGQVAVPVARLASQADFRVHVVDTRPRFASRERFPTAHEVLVGFPGEIARARNFNQFSFALLLAHAAKHDLPVLDVLLRTDVRYIGVLGSSKRAAALGKRLKEMGFSDNDLGRIQIPVGLDIGAETAEQIAISIVGELLMARTGGTGKSLRQVRGLPPLG